MAADLAKDFEVTSVDASEAALEKLGAKHPGIARVRKDLSDPKVVTELVAGFDLVLNAVPGFMGYRTLEAILRAGKNVVDIAFCPEDFFPLDPLAKERGVTALVDFGVAPGMSNLFAGKVDAELDETETVLIYVGGLPETRTWPFEYKAGFSPIDVIEEYTRLARYVENGALVVRPALTDPEILEFPRIGSLEAFNTDGLRSLAETIRAPNLKEKTLRYVGHIEKMRVLREMGLFDQEEIEIAGTKISPLDFTTRLLFPMWKLEEGEVDITVMRIIVEGKKDGKRRRTTYDLYDRYDEATGVHSMARTTGYTATMGIRMLAAGLFDQKGIIVPEFVGPHPECVDFLRAGLAERGIVYEERVEELD